MSGWQWWHGPGSSPDAYRGPFATREEALAEARVEYGKNEIFSIVEARKARFTPPRADDLMDQFLDRWADEDMGAEEAPEFEGDKAAIQAAEADLDRLLKEWAERHAAIIPEPWTFAATRNAETFEGVRHAD